MTLLADYQARYPTSTRTNVSNPGNTTATTPNTTIEGLAAGDVAARFQTICGVTYDSTVAPHVEACVPLVYIKMQVWTGQVQQSDYEAAAEYLDTLKMTLGRDRLSPYTDSTKTRTPDPTGATVDTDWSKSVHVVPQLPGGGSSTADSIGNNV